MSKTPPTLPQVFIIFLILLPFSVISQSLDDEKTILLKLKQQWGNLPPMDTWDSSSSTSPCNWTGIQCSTRNDTVTGILLRNLTSPIDAEIPSFICDLENLTTLDLAWNYIPNTFPTVLYNCSNLQRLDISQNLLVGTLPNDINRLSPKLQYLDVSGNNFTGDVPKSIAKLTELTTLHLDQNLFNGTVPADMGNLEKLETLSMAFNPFSPMEIPPEWGNLKNVKFLRMTDCNLIGEIPQSFGNLSSLELLDLVQNDLRGSIPNGLFQLKNLSYLYLYKNRLDGEIPTSVTALNLIKLDLSMNNLTGSIPQDFGKLHKLEILNLFNNDLSGEVPDSIGLLPALRLFKLFVNKLSGTLPPELGLHSKLEAFEVDNNGFSGQLPQNLCANGALTGIVAFSNRLNGSIPESIGSCSTLRTIQLYGNNLSGEVPSGIWTLNSLYSVMIHDNAISGELPTQLSWNMTRLEIGNNRFSGQIPAEVKDWKNLQFLDASNNLITGTLPLELTSLSHLSSLLLDRNQISGQIPSDIISWKVLTTLNLAANELSGSIPASLGSLPNLIDLDLSDNKLSGQIPEELGQLNFISLDLSSNKLTGMVPNPLDNMAYGNSFLNNTKLCAGGVISSLPKCSNFHHGSKSLSFKYLAMILVLAVVALLFTLYFSVYMIRDFRQRKHRDDLESWKLTSFHRLDFTEANILSSLTDHNLIGSGGSGKVYKISINRSGECVAVKKIWNNRKLDTAQFLAEVQILGTIRHANIVKLLCCISSEESKLLVYEYMENQSLDQWIHGKRRKTGGGDQVVALLVSEGGTVHDVMLDWPTRLRIAIGAAQGLCYMHHDSSPPIIHRDVKSSNILLDSNFNAKIADFGLAKTTIKQGELNTMSAVAGSFGYLAPEYCYTRKVSEKIDVFSFGVVLLELVTGKEPNGEEDGMNLADWSWKYYSEGHPLQDALDADTKEPCFLEDMTTVFQLGLMCTSTLPSSRPSMKEVVQLLRRCSPLLENDAAGRTKTGNEHDFSPLLGTGNPSSIFKNNCRRAGEADDFSMV